MIRYTSNSETRITTAEFVDKVNGELVPSDWKKIVRNKLSKIMAGSSYIHHENFWNKINIGVNGIHTKVEVKCSDLANFDAQKEQQIARAKLLHLMNTALQNALICANRYIEKNSHNLILKNEKNIDLLKERDKNENLLLS